MSACDINFAIFLTQFYFFQDVKNVLYVHDLKSGNRLHQIPLEIGSISSVWGRKRYSEVFFMFTSIIIPNTSYRIDMTENPPKVQLLRETEIPGFRKEDYKVCLLTLDKMLLSLNQSKIRTDSLTFLLLM